MSAEKGILTPIPVEGLKSRGDIFFNPYAIR
jgi:hypothetical protein